MVIVMYLERGAISGSRGGYANSDRTTSVVNLHLKKNKGWMKSGSSFGFASPFRRDGGGYIPSRPGITGGGSVCRHGAGPLPSNIGAVP